ncbi:MAG: T9SS type A sorting domain-containing protein, partial [Bacteroidota bacterium]|nr:T9SS type A sorting domain-containing protein [Bacteroidota bacterium]
IVHGPNPTLPANAGVNDNIPMQFDFRSIYTSILKDWFQVTPATLTQLFGQSFPYVPVLRPGAVTATAAAVETAEFTVYPNPVARDGSATVAYDCAGGHVQVVVLDTLGREVRRALDRVVPAGLQQLPLDLSGLAAGAYYCQVRENRRTGSRIVVVE